LILHTLPKPRLHHRPGGPAAAEMASLHPVTGIGKFCNQHDAR